MPQRKGAATQGLGRGIANEHRRRSAKLLQQASLAYSAGVCEEQASCSVLEQSSIDEVIATVEIKKETYAQAWGEAEVMEDPVFVAAPPVIDAERVASRKRELVSIPRRPKWREGMSAQEFASLESEAFMEWRRGLAEMAHEQSLHMTPYERNIDFWRQLWRCLERSDLIVQIVDARDPDFYHCRDLGRYVDELGGSRSLLLLVNKADFLTPKLRQSWADHFARCGVHAIFFSALYELRRQQQCQGPLPPAVVPLPVMLPLAGAAAADSFDHVEIPVPHSSDDEAEAAEPTKDFDSPLGPLGDSDIGVVDCERLLEELRARLPARAQQQEGGEPHHRRGTVGFVGYPNVGKSTVINALVGAKKVGMSRRPGKTKHIQTLELPEYGLTLCDCPGLVFPSIVATKAHLVINNTVPIDDLRECWSPVRLIVEKVGFDRILKKYACAGMVRDAATRSGDHVLDNAHSFLAAFAVSRNHFLRVGVPDENWAARTVLRDYCMGTLLHCEEPPPPPDEGKDRRDAGGGDKTIGTAGQVTTKQEEEEDEEEQEQEEQVPASIRSLASSHPQKEDSSLSPVIAAALGSAEVQLSQGVEDDDDDFGDLDAFLMCGSTDGHVTGVTRGALPSGRTAAHPRHITKRKERQMRKQCLKGGGAAIPSAPVLNAAADMLAPSLGACRA